MFRKLLVEHFVIITITVTLILFVSFTEIRHHYIDTLTSTLTEKANILAPTVTSMLHEHDIDRIDSFVDSMGELANIRITVVDTAGVVLGDSKKDPHMMENHRNRPEIMAAYAGRIGTSIRYSTTLKQHMLYVAIPIVKDGHLLGVLRTSMSLHRIDYLLGRLRSKILRYSIIMLLIMVIITTYFTKRISAPIREMLNVVHEMSSGNLSVRIHSTSRDEIGRLANAFNHMATEMERMFHEITVEREKLHTIIANLHEGLLVMRQTGTIILVNNSLKNIVGDTAVGKFYWQVLRYPDFMKLIEQLLQSRQPTHSEVVIDDKTYLCSATMTPTHDIIVVFHDITEMKQLERMKRDFVVNVSHELRTPLTAIKGFVETIEEMTNDTQIQHYLQIIKRHTDRMINIVADLLTLAKLEDKTIQLDKQKIYLPDIASDVIKIFTPNAQRKGLTIEMKLHEPIPEIEADPSLLEQLIINLIDNAIKYTDEGKVVLEISHNDNFVKLTVKDTGIGIPAEHINRIFERFYVVDKSRSKRHGGTGLGLSIVKHIVLLHNGKIDVKSTPGKGSTFTVYLPTS